MYNIQPLCKSCNSSKHAKIIDYRYELHPEFSDLNDALDIFLTA